MFSCMLWLWFTGSPDAWLTHGSLVPLVTTAWMPISAA